MRILFVPSDNNFTSGAFRSMAMLNKILNSELGVDTLVVLPNKSGDGVNLLDAYGVRYVFIDSYNWIIKNHDKIPQSVLEEMAVNEEKNKKAVSEFVELIRREKIDLVHINTSYSYVAALAAKETNTPVVWHLREFLEEDQERRFFERGRSLKLISESSAIVCISKSLNEKYNGLLPKDKLHTIYNGIDTTEFLKPNRQIFQDDNVVFSCVGAISHNKGQDVLVEAVGKLYQKGFKKFTLQLAGVCNERWEKEIKATAAKYGIESNLVFLGRINNVSDVFAKTDIAFMCSKFEAFGRTTVEAMLSGCLVIGAKTGGTTEILDDARTGLFYMQPNSDDLCEKILHALENRKEMRSIARAGQEEALKRFSALSNAKQIKTLYERIMKLKKPEVSAVVVTYNRLNLLKDCIGALQKQDYESLNIIIVDNASNDGTCEYVKSLVDPRIVYVNTGENIGGAGGFYEGIKYAYDYGAKWVWVMDDDVVPQPSALRKLIEASKIPRGKLSFLASSVYSPNNEAMNTPGVDLRSGNGYPFWFKYLDKGLVNINAATFVSILIPSAAISKVGFPCRHFFIWGDDTEYTKRLYRYYGNAYIVGQSKVIHNRGIEKALSIFDEVEPRRIKMYFYFIRNTLTYTNEYAGEDALNAKMKMYKKDIRFLRFSRDEHKKLKIRTIKEGMSAFLNDRMSQELFKNRFDLNLDYKNFTLPELTSYQRFKNLLKRLLPKKIVNGIRCLKANGFKYTLKRILLGKKRFAEKLNNK